MLSLVMRNVNELYNKIDADTRYVSMQILDTCIFKRWGVYRATYLLFLL
jgi:hypothetical protein